MATEPRKRRWVWLLAPALVSWAGCGDTAWDWFRQKPEAATRPAGTLDAGALRTAGASSPAIEGTIGSAAYVQGLKLMRVRGFGLVIGLGDKGSRNCRPSVREQVIKDLRRYHSANPHLARNLPTAEKQVDGLDSSVVEVLADIPAGAAKDQHFDVFVRADDPDTKSLAGGYLVPCDLRIYQEVSPAEGIEGRIHARAAGPIFVNPFAGSGAGGEPLPAPSSQPAQGGEFNLREGRIIGGGLNQIDRRLSLVATMESYATVRQIQDSINRRFTDETKIADAVSPSNITLKIPKEYRNRRQYFLDLVMHLPLSTSQAAREARASMLIGELGRPGAPLDDTALSLEGIGPSVLPMLQPIYTEPRKQVSFYAARTGVRLGDRLGVEVLTRHANDPRSSCRMAAIRELGNVTGIAMAERAGSALRELLNQSDPRIRILAYEALRKVDPESVSRYIVGERPQNFLLEMVPSDGPPLIYARRTEMRRLALIGGDRLVFQPPLLYSQPGQPVSLTAREEERNITIFRKDVSGRTLGPFQTPLSLAPVVRFMGNDLRTNLEGRINGLGLDYAIVLDVLYRLSQKGAVNAEMRWEEPSVEDLIGPLEPMGRPESEL